MSATNTFTSSAKTADERPHRGGDSLSPPGQTNMTLFGEQNPERARPGRNNVKNTKTAKLLTVAAAQFLGLFPSPSVFICVHLGLKNSDFPPLHPLCALCASARIIPLSAFDLSSLIP
jgi:hypothetical protein